MSERIPGFSTLAVHAGAQPDPTTGARATPIYQTTSFVFESVDHAASLFGLQTFGNIYSRIGNPTNAVLEERVAALEGGTAGLAVGSGHAAQVLVFHCLLQPGDEFVASKKLYGGSINQFNHAFKNFGWNVVWADPNDIGTFERAISPKTKAIFIESIANPGGVITDIEAIGNVARRAGVPLIVDNTLATPYLCRPIEHGADIVVHSLTKFLGGHGNSIGGLIVDPQRMAANLGMTHGLIVAEAVMMGLAPHIGRNEAHDLVYDACRAAIETDRPLYDVLLEIPAVVGPLGPEALEALTDPANYLGAAPAMVDRVLAGR